MDSHQQDRRPQPLVLPTEIVFEITRHFAPQDQLEHCPTITPLEYVLIRRRQNTLATLCLSCKAFNAVATQVLYRTAALVRKRPDDKPDQKQGDGQPSFTSPLPLFLRALCEKPELRPMVKRLTCFVTLLSPQVYYMDSEVDTVLDAESHCDKAAEADAMAPVLTWEAIVSGNVVTYESMSGVVVGHAFKPGRQLDPRRLSANDTAILACTGMLDGEGHFDTSSSPEAMFAASLGLLGGNIQALTLHCPWLPSVLSDNPTGADRYWMLDDMLRVLRRQHHDPLKKLKYLSVVPDDDPSASRRSYNYHGSVKVCAGVCPALFEAPSLAVLNMAKLTTVDESRQIDPSKGNPVLRQAFMRTKSVTMTHFVLTGSLLLDLLGPGSARLTHIDLRDFIYGCHDWTGGRIGGSFRDGFPITNEKFSRFAADRLTSLIFCHSGSTVRSYEPAFALGPRGVMHCLSSFSKLQRLQLDVWLLVDRKADIGRTKLEEMLPPSLRSLCLVGSWRDGDGPGSPGDDGYDLCQQELGTMLGRFAPACKARCPRLRIVAWKDARELSRAAREWMKYSSRSVESLQAEDGPFCPDSPSSPLAVPQMANLFRREGVRFLWFPPSVLYSDMEEYLRVDDAG